MTLIYITILIILLALPVILLFVPNISAGMITPTHKREARDFLYGNDAKAKIDYDKHKKSLIGKLTGSSKKSSTSRLTIAKRLKFAQWPISQLTFHALEVLISLLAFSILSPYLGAFLQIFVFIIGPVVMRMILSAGVNYRFKKFDRDFPQFLLSIVGLLKTGMTPTNAIEAAANGLDAKSLVRSEVKIMLERMRMGVPEDRSIGAFAETINHPEIELFIQALLLSKRVGGTLSDTLERLAKQVRKRQYFRDSANAAVAMQRASGWVILGILVSLEIYIYFTSPNLVIDAWNNPIGWMVWQSAIFTIFISMIWSREITKIKV